MKAILSTTPDDLYMFSLPFAIHSWNKLGIDCVVITTPVHDPSMVARALLVVEQCQRLQCKIYSAHCPPEKAATYAQCARLYAAALPGIGMAENLITADADMCVFDVDFWGQFDLSGWINVIGVDLVPAKQFPMCYISMPIAGWDAVMEIRGRTMQQCVDDLLGHIECDNFRGNYWGKDQETIYNQIAKISPDFSLVQFQTRASPGTQFATRRADRDGWPEAIPLDLIDAHLPRPGYLWENLIKIVHLFDEMYPEDDHNWMVQYAEDYIELL